MGKSLSIRLPLFTLLLLLFFSCKEEKKASTEVTVDIVMKNHEYVVRQGETIELDNDLDLIISLFRMYLSNVTLNTNSGSEIDLIDVALVDPSKIGSNSFKTEIDANHFSSISFGLGLNADMNNLNAADFDLEHPLSTYQGMHWSMIKYRFASLMGKVNNKGSLGGMDDIPLNIHTGTDALYRTTEIPINFIASEGDKINITLNIDVNQLFVGNNPFVFPDEAQTHSTPSDIHVADKFMTNLESSLSATLSTK